MRSYYKAYKKVGRIETSLAEKLGLQLNGGVYISPGVLKHIKRRHNKQLTRGVKDNLVRVIEEILKEPEYVGARIKNSRNMIEFIKKVDSFLLLGLEIDQEEGYIYVSTLYPITKGKLENRIFSGKLVKI